MLKTDEHIVTTRESYLAGARAHTAEWMKELQRLTASRADDPRTAELRALWPQMLTGLTELEQAGDDTWRQAAARWLERAEQFTRALNRLLGRPEPEDESLGWAQGFSEQRMPDSEGWAEGMGKRPADSEGWAEGLGHREASSHGWAEGYEEPAA